MIDDPSYYDILDLGPDASPQKIREAYIRIKNTFTRDSPALYTLISEDEQSDELHRIEEAYEVLSNPERRRVYDRAHGSIELPRDEEESLTGDLDSEESLLISPRTDFDYKPAPETQKSSESSFFETPQPRAESQGSLKSGATAASNEEGNDGEWRGPKLRQIRNLRQISLEEMSSITKVSKAYLHAIEEEDFKKLPAPVYVRGFVMQIAKILKLPVDEVSKAYLSRLSPK